MGHTGQQLLSDVDCAVRFDGVVGWTLVSFDGFVRCLLGVGIVSDADLPDIGIGRLLVCNTVYHSCWWQLLLC